jgi:hypothetical protein
VIVVLCSCARNQASDAVQLVWGTGGGRVDDDVRLVGDDKPGGAKIALSPVRVPERDERREVPIPAYKVNDSSLIRPL